MRSNNRQKPEPLRVPIVASKDVAEMLRRVVARPTDDWRMPPRLRNNRLAISINPIVRRF